MEPQIQQITCATYTYAPNWYRYQCLLFDCQKVLYYASNYTLYEYNIQKRRVMRDLSFRNIALKQKNKGMNSKNIKIQAMISFQNQGKQLMAIGLNQKLIIIMDKKSFQVSNIHNIQWQNGIQGFFYSKNHSLMIIWSQLGILKALKPLTLQNASSYNTNEKIKQLTTISISNHEFILLVTNRGQLRFVKPDLSAQISKITQQQMKLNQHFVLSIDLWIEGCTIKMAILTKNKGNILYLTVTTVQFVEDKLQFIKDNQNLVHTQVKFSYPKLMFEKIKNASKAALTIKFLTQKHLLMSGKLGQNFIININLVSNDNSINIKPHSLDDIPKWLQVSDDSKHYKDIFSIYLVTSSKLFMLGTDQILSQWKIINNHDKVKLKSISTIKFLTSQAVSIFRSEADPKTMFALLRDGIIRSCSPLSPVSHFLQQHWKFTKKFKIIKCTAHPLEAGILALITDCGRILIYDIFQDRLMRIIELQKQMNSKDIINITFEYNSIKKPIKVINNLVKDQKQEIHQWVPRNIKINLYFQKQQPENIGIVIQLSQKFVFIQKQIESKDNQDKLKKKYACYEIKRPFRVQRIHNSKLWDQQTLLFSQNKGGILKLWLYYDGTVGYHETKLNIQGSRCIFKIISLSDQTRALLIFQFKNKKIFVKRIKLTELKIEAQYKQLMKKQQEYQINQIELDVPLSIEQLVLDYWSNQLAAYNQKQDVLGYLNFQKLIQSMQNSCPIKFQCFQMNSKIETISFYETNYLAISFKDQSIKVFHLNDLKK